jgi:hypothetical protein
VYVCMYVCVYVCVHGVCACWRTQYMESRSVRYRHLLMGMNVCVYVCMCVCMCVFSYATDLWTEFPGCRLAFEFLTSMRAASYHLAGGKPDGPLELFCLGGDDFVLGRMA